MRFVRSILALMTVAMVIGCRAGDHSGDPSPARAGASAFVAPPPTEEPSLLAGAPITFRTSDGATLAGDLYLAKERRSPAVVLVHRQFRDRGEWRPLVDALRSAKSPPTVLAFDLRGQGESRLPPAQPAQKRAATSSAEDVRAAIAAVLEATGGATSGIVLIGSSLGAALVSQAAVSEPKVVALGMISPGMDLDGQDALHPFATVRELPAFIAMAADDNVSKEPVALLERIAKSGTIKRYPGAGHGADALGAQAPALFTDLEGWLESVRDAKPIPRALEGAPARGALVAEPTGKRARASTGGGRP